VYFSHGCVCVCEATLKGAILMSGYDKYPMYIILDIHVQVLTFLTLLLRPPFGGRSGVLILSHRVRWAIFTCGNAHVLCSWNNQGNCLRLKNKSAYFHGSLEDKQRNTRSLGDNIFKPQLKSIVEIIMLSGFLQAVSQGYHPLRQFGLVTRVWHVCCRPVKPLSARYAAVYVYLCLIL